MNRSTTAAAAIQRGPSRAGVCAALLAVAVAIPATRGADPVADPPAFQPGAISIGEPIALPFERPQTESPRTLPTAPQRAEAVAAAAIPGNGWLGLVVAEASTPGRFMVAEVAAEGPAAVAGIQTGDEVRAINGLPLRTSDDVSQALTAIAPGQQVRLAVAKGEQVSDVALEAIARPAAARARAEIDALPTAPQGPVAAATATPAPLPLSPPPLTTAVNVQTPPVQTLTPPTVPAVTSPPGFVSTLPTQAPPAMPAAAPTQPAAPDRFSPPRAAAATFEPLAEPTATPSLPDTTRGRTALGVRTLPIDPSLQARFRLPEASGAYVIGVVGDLPASKAGVPPGSVIVAIDNRPVRSPDELTRLVTAGPVDRPVPLEYVLPGGTPRRADVVLQTLEQPLEEALVGVAQPTVTAVPTLEPQPTPAAARRPVVPPDAASLQEEIRQLRARLDTLERRLEANAR